MRLHEPSPQTRQQSQASKSHCACYVAYKAVLADRGNRLIDRLLRLESMSFHHHASGQFTQQIKKRLAHG
jgi:hypothetical protein